MRVIDDAAAADDADAVIGFGRQRDGVVVLVAGEVHAVYWPPISQPLTAPIPNPSPDSGEGSLSSGSGAIDRARPVPRSAHGNSGRGLLRVTQDRFCGVDRRDGALDGGVDDVDEFGKIAGARELTGVTVQFGEAVIERNRGVDVRVVPG